MTIKNKINKYLNMFEIKERNGDNIVVFKNNVSQDLRDSVYKAHGEHLPDDWIFDKYQSILSNLSDYDINSLDDIEDNRSEIVDGLVDVYTSDLTSWLNSHNDNVYYIEEAQKTFGAIDDGFQLLSSAQYIAIDEIYSEVINLLSD